MCVYVYAWGGGGVPGPVKKGGGEGDAPDRRGADEDMIRGRTEWTNWNPNVVTPWMA